MLPRSLQLDVPSQSYGRKLLLNRASKHNSELHSHSWSFDLEKSIQRGPFQTCSYCLSPLCAPLSRGNGRYSWTWNFQPLATRKRYWHEGDNLKLWIAVFDCRVGLSKVPGSKASKAVRSKNFRVLHKGQEATEPSTIQGHPVRFPSVVVRKCEDKASRQARQ